MQVNLESCIHLLLFQGVLTPHPNPQLRLQAVNTRKPPPAWVHKRQFSDYVVLFSLLNPPVVWSQERGNHIRSGDLWIIRYSFVIMKRKYRFFVFCFSNGKTK